MIAVLASSVVLTVGIQYLVKMSFIIAAAVILTIILTFVLLIGHMDFSNFLPVLKQEPKVYLEAISQFVLVPGSQTLCLLMLPPMLQSTRRFTKITLTGFSAGILLLLIVSIRNTAVLGAAATIVNSASFFASRMIEIGDIFTRVDFIVSLNITILVFLSICIIHHAAAQSLAQLFGVRSIKWFIIPTGVIGIVLALTLFNSSIEHIEFAKNYNLPLFGAFNFIIPPAALLTAKLRKMKKPADDG